MSICKLRFNKVPVGRASDLIHLLVGAGASCLLQVQRDSTGVVLLLQIFIDVVEYPQSMFWSKNKKNMYTPANPSFTV